MADVPSLLGTLSDVIANLDDYIERRAAERAASRIAEGGAAAAERVQSARGMQQRAEDLATELRRQLNARDRQVDDLRRRVEEAEAIIRATNAVESVSTAIELEETYCAKYGVTLDGCT
ncbi:glutamyl-tRNA reductase [Nonomuraea thailandensis]|uniref:Glutamyl-tRNA reductase n=1 Tax=Nonomuraea thailandensis TaxID=1188745 RepID=A0A9X2GPD2_9ACTN|nr:hypothetical protein [Nonomuraea thailandensis]MCP2363044.1 glutamyl-tRNA reductase [Nonomuraea thailandensis]